MSSRGRFKCKRIFKMLDDCAPGWDKEWKEHYIWLTFDNRVIKDFPKGKRRGDYRFEVHMGVIRGIASEFDIENCAKKYFPNL